MKLNVYLLLLFPLMVSGQEKLTLEQCQTLARENYPLLKQTAMLDKITDLKITNHNTFFYPRFNVGGQASWQSDVTKIPIDNPMIDIPEVDKDNYKIYLDISQVIYDGGMITTQKKIEKAGLAIDQQNLNAELYKLKEKINGLYFLILMNQESEKILQLLKKDIESKLRKIQAGVKYGTNLNSNAAILEVELLKLEGQILDLKSAREATLEMLRVYTGKDLSAVIFELPELNIPNDNQLINRPEMLVFDLQKEKLEASSKLTSVKMRPTLSAFAQMGYGKPGLNMLVSEFDDYYLFGARLAWTPFNWNSSSRERQIISIQQDIINTQKETFEKIYLANQQKALAEIDKCEALIALDTVMIELRERISKTAASQLENGTITSTEYLTEVNAEASARMNLEYHKIMMVKAKVDYMTNKGDF